MSQLAVDARADIAARGDWRGSIGAVGHERALRILMVCARAFPLMGGIETHVHEVASRLAAGGHAVTVLTTDRAGTLPTDEIVSGVRIIRVRAYPANTDYYFAPGVYRNVAEGRWDIVHIQGYHTLIAPIGMLAAIRKQVPFVLTFHSGGHSSQLRTALRRPQWAVLRPLIRQASQLIGVSRFEADFFSEAMAIPRERIRVVANGARLPAVDPATVAPRTGRLIVSLGRLEKYKGHHRAIEAMPHLLREIPEAHLKIVGNGPFEAELRRLVRRLGLERHVSLGGIPPSDRQAMAALLASADLVVLLSEYEAHPVAIMEALSLNARVLTSNTSGFRELAERGLVRTTPLSLSAAGTAEAIAEALKAEPTARVLALPDWDDCAAELARVYRACARAT
ncbi:MAG: glycosyltransferase family 4 protein [Xanthobacteraceae bacterium]